MRVPLKRGHRNSNFLTTHAKHEIFRIGKYEKKIKFDKIWRYLNEGIPLKQRRQNSKFNHLS